MSQPLHLIKNTVITLISLQECSQKCHQRSKPNKVIMTSCTRLHAFLKALPLKSLIYHHDQHLVIIADTPVSITVIHHSASPAIVMSLTQRIADAKMKLEDATSLFTKLQTKSGSLSHSIAAHDEKSVKTLVNAGVNLKGVRTFNHHASDVTCMQWSGGSDDQMFVSAGKDGQVAVWNGLTKKKVQSMTVDMKMLMTCAFEKKKNQLVAAGGADKCLSVFPVGQAGILHPIAELT